MLTIRSLLICLILLVFTFSMSFSGDIHQAAQNGELAKVEELLKQNLQLVHARDETGRTPLHWAARGVHFDVINLLIKNGAEVNVRDNANVIALHSLAARGHLEAAELLITHGADLTAKDVTGNTPLSYAVSGSHKAVVDLLLNNGVKIPIQGDDARWLLHTAASSGYREFIDRMLAQGVDVNLKNNSGGTLLHSAVDGGHHELVVMLLKQHFNVNARDRLTITPLHIAAFNGNIDIIQLLAENGADLNARTTAALTPLYFAQFTHKTEAAGLLISLGADQNLARFTELKGNYFGQQKPGQTPDLFATGIMPSLASLQSAPVFSPDGKEVYWSVFFGPPFRLVILFMKLEQGRWTVPQIPSFCDAFYYFNPVFAPDGKRLYFISNRPLEQDAASPGFNNWYVERTDTGWSAPKHHGTAINSNNDWGASITKDGTLYFASGRDGGLGAEDIYRSRLVHGQYSRPENLGLSINTRARDTYPFIAPDESYLLFISNRSAGEFGGLDQFFDIYLSFRQQDGSWTPAQKLENGINSDKFENTPVVSPDGKYLFFLSQRHGGPGEVYWIDAKIIEAQKQTSLSAPTNASFSELSGPYIGQKPPDSKPEIFAPGIVNFGLFTRDLAMTPDGKVFYFRVGLAGFSRSVILETRMIQGRWTVPEVASFSADRRWRHLEPCLSPDGKELFFVSDRPAEPLSDKPGPFGIWTMPRTGDGWSQPTRLDDAINGPAEAFFPSVTLDGTLYFCRWGADHHGTIWRARSGTNGYLPPEKLPGQVNCGDNRSNAFVAPDESYVILPVSGRADSQGGRDYYIVYRRPDDTWCDPVNLGPTINTPLNGENSAFVSRDGRYLFFMSARISGEFFAPGEKLTLKKLKALANQPGANGDAAIYWVDANILEPLRPAK